MGRTEAPTLSIGGCDATLTAPSATGALALCRTEEDRHTDGHEVGKVLGAAALALCWPNGAKWPGPTRPARWWCGEPILRYGQTVLDDLVDGAGIHVLDLLPALAQAYDYAIDARIICEELRAAQDFSDRPPGA